jgi:hypothetical protein
MRAKVARRADSLVLVGHYSVWHVQVLSLGHGCHAGLVRLEPHTLRLGPRPCVACQPGMTAEG